MNAGAVFRQAFKGIAVIQSPDDDVLHRVHAEIVDIMLKSICRRTLTQMNLKLTVDDTAKAFLVEKGYDEKYGARPLRRAIQNLLEDKLAEAVLDGEVKAGDEVTVTKGEDSLKFLSAEVIKN